MRGFILFSLTNTNFRINCIRAETGSVARRSLDAEPDHVLQDPAKETSDLRSSLRIVQPVVFFSKRSCNGTTLPLLSAVVGILCVQHPRPGPTGRIPAGSAHAV